MFFSSACSTFSKSKKNQDVKAEIETLQTTFCLNSEGRARFKDAKGSHVFSFDSKFAGNRWDLLVNIPLKGEEEITFELASLGTQHKLNTKSSKPVHVKRIYAQNPKLELAMKFVMQLYISLKDKPQIICDKSDKSDDRYGFKCRIGPMKAVVLLENDRVFFSELVMDQEELDMQVVMTKGNEHVSKVDIAMRNNSLADFELLMFINVCNEKK